MGHLLEEIAILLGCEISALHDHMNHPVNNRKIIDFLKNKKLRTTYTNRNGDKEELKFGGISIKSCSEEYAYEGFLKMYVLCNIM